MRTSQHGGISGHVQRRRVCRRVKGLVRCAANALSNYTDATIRMYSGQGGKTLAEAARPHDAIRSTVDTLMEALQEKGKIAQSLYTQPLMAMQLVRLAEFVDESEWIRPIDDWEPEDVDEVLLKAMMDKSPYEARELIRSHTVDQFDHLLKHLLVQYDDVPKALLNSLAPVYGLAPAQHWARAESPFLNARTWLMCRRFARVLVDVGRGDSAAKALKSHVSPSLNKAMTHEFMTIDHTVQSPTHALRIAQVTALGGSENMSIAACNSSLGRTLGSISEEEFAQSMLQWMCTREADLDNVNNAMVMNHLLVNFEAHAAKGEMFSMKGRTPSSVLRTASDVQEIFSRSGLSNMSWEDPDAESKAHKYVEVREILSATMLLQVGQAMENCLSKPQGIHKYSHRARSKSSSFWIVCYRDAESVLRNQDKIQNEEDTESLECIMVFEVWNESKIVHQAEGPGSSVPSRAAQRHMRTWAEAQDVQWNTWEMW